MHVIPEQKGDVAPKEIINAELTKREESSMSVNSTENMAESKKNQIMSIIRKYSIFDDKGNIIGVKDDAPEQLKRAFEKYLNNNNE